MDQFPRELHPPLAAGSETVSPDQTTKAYPELMENIKAAQRLRFTFRGNGIVVGKRMAEATAELLEDHDPYADPVLAHKQSWFGQEDTITASLEKLNVPARDIAGVLSTLHVNKVASLELELTPDELTGAGFAPSR